MQIYFINFFFIFSIASFPVIICNVFYAIFAWLFYGLKVMKGLIDLIKQNKVYYYTILLFVIAGGIILCLVPKVDVTLWINSHSNPLLDRLVLEFNGGGEVGFGVVSVGFIWILRDWRLAAKAACCFLSVLIIIVFMKYVLFPGTPRPILLFPEGTLRLVEGVIQLETESFPSGHTSSAFSIATFFALFQTKKKWIFIFALLALIVGCGRIYLSQHFITDVYTGMIVSVIVTTLVYHYYPKSWERKHAK